MNIYDNYNSIWHSSLTEFYFVCSFCTLGPHKTKQVRETIYKNNFLDHVLYNKCNGLYINLLLLILSQLILTIYPLLHFDTSSQTTLSKIHTEDLLCSRHSEIVTPLKNNLKSIDHIVCTYTNETKAQKNKSGLFNQGFESQDQNQVLCL